jgi:predicted dehydrogenase
MTAERKVRYAVIGCGVIGPVHADAITRLPNAELVATCDVIEERARLCAEKFDATPYTDFREMLRAEQPEAVSIGTPHHNHAEIAVACLEAGVHVLCEKPLAMSREQMDAMEQAAEKSGAVLGGIFQHRFDPVTAAMKQAVDDGLFGDVLNAGASIRCYRGPDYYAGGEWRGTWDGEGGAVLINQAIHSVDVMQWLAGPVCSVWGRYTNLKLQDVIETEDTAGALLELAGGGTGTIEATSASHLSFEAGVHFYGTHGSFRLSTGGENQVEFLRMDTEERAAEVQKLLAAAENDEGPVREGKACYGNSHARQIDDFIQSLLEERSPRITGHDARHAVEIVLAVYESANNGRPVGIKK